MIIKIGKLKGMYAELESKIKERGIKDCAQLLEATKTPAGRQELAEYAGVDVGVILALSNRADLSRVKGVAGVYSDLLEKAGVDTVKELAMRNPANLYAKLQEVNATENLAGRLPNLRIVEDWVAQAKELPKMLEY